MIVAVLVIVGVPGAGASTVAAIVKVADVPARRLGTLQSELAGSKLPSEGTPGCQLENPLGNGSLTSTFVASSGPWLVSVIVKVSVSPTFGVELLAVFWIPRSAARPVNSAAAVLFAG